MLSIVRSRGALTRRFVTKSYCSWIHDGGVDDDPRASAGRCEADVAAAPAA
jgi:hypothetical protein